jgi:probable F420-dependent oxidoreductase
VRLGVHLPQFRKPVDGETLAAAARAAEEAGADDLWVSDHLILPAGSERPPASFHDPLTVLTWAAASTRRAGLGTSVLVAPYRHPVVLAKAVASLDALSGGRVVLGLASGWHEGEFAALGVPFRERGRRTDATIRACRALWSGAGELTWEGVRHDGLALLPAPAQDGGPPVWVGGNSDAGIRRAVRLGDGWHTTIADAEHLPERVATLEAALAEAGRARTGFVLSVRMRADHARMARVAPRLRDLGVDHVLVDPPMFDAGRFGEEVAALRRLADG